MSEIETLPGIIVGPGAARRIREILSGQPPEKFVRLAVNAGGCSGFSYSFDLDDRREPDDRLFGEHGAGLVVDPASLDLLAGSVVEFEESLAGSAFRVSNPNATSGCGCGTSFSV
jgi:iron-sulfur cluster assembly accessory protein